jgi:hypothetical protein
MTSPAYRKIAIRILSIWVIGVVWLTGSTVLGQATSGTILGTVRDTTGAAIPGATVLVINVETNISSTWTTNDEGDFTAPFQLPGEYRVTVEKQGFKKAVRNGITLFVGERPRINFELEVGQIAETVTAVAEAPLVKSESSEIGQVIEGRPIQELPLNSATGRNFTALMTLIPGTLRTNPVGLFDAPQGNSSFSVNGQRDGANNYTVDGADNNEVLLGIVSVLPPPDAVGEFKIQTNAYSAESGRAGGAVVNVQTRSGTNSFRGSLYHFFRNDALDARGPFDLASAPLPQKPPLRQNEYGGTIGGPIRKNRTFFFFDYVGFKQRAGQTFITSVPTLEQRQGRFLTGEGAPPIFDPLTKQQFANNVIPDNRINPVSKRIINLHPAPNRPGTARANQGVADNYIGVSVQQQDASRFDAKVDHALTSKDAFFVRYSFFDAFTAVPSLFGEVASSVPSRAGRGDARDQSVVLSNVHTFSGTKINETRLAYSRIVTNFTGHDTGKNLATDLGIPNINIFGEISTGLPRISIENIAASLGTDAPIPALRVEDNFQIVNNFTYIRGQHNIKFGGDIRYLQADFFQISLESPRGNFAFDRNYSSNNGAANTGLGVASLLLGFPASERRGVIYHFPSNRLKQFFFFAQDDFKATRKLTLNYGLRYELYMPVTDKYDNQANFDVATGKVLLANRGNNSKSLVKTDKNNFGPRLGFAYSLNDRMVLRGGYGISYYTDKFGATGGTLNTNYPFITLQEIVPADRFTPTPTLTISNGITVPVRPDLTQPTVDLVGNILAFDPNYRNAYVQSWNLTVQRQLSRDLVVEAAYVGTKGTHLFGNNHVNLNQPDPGPGVIATRRPYATRAPLAVTISLRDSSQSSIYHALQIKMEKRLGHGLWFLNSYAWSKSIDDAVAKINPRDWRTLARGPSGTDFTHQVISSALYELPFGRGRKFGANMSPVLDAIIGGWQINGIFTYRTGLPLTTSLSAGLAAASLNNGGNNRPDQISDPELPGEDRTLARYFNTAAFVAPATNSFRFGNAGRGTIRGPGFSNLDFSIFKTFKFKERYAFQLRGEFFNLPNHPSFGNPNTQLGSATFGSINTAASAPRQVQLAAKLTF